MGMKQLSILKSEARASDLSLQIEDLDHELAESRALAEHLTAQEAGFSRRLAESRRISAQHQRDHEVTAKQVDELQSQLSAHRQIMEQLIRDLGEARNLESAVSNRISIIKASKREPRRSRNNPSRPLKRERKAPIAIDSRMSNLQPIGKEGGIARD